MRTLIDWFLSLVNKNADSTSNEEFQGLYDGLEEIRKNWKPVEINPIDEVLMTWLSGERGQADPRKRTFAPGGCSYLIGVKIPSREEEVREIMERSSDGYIVLETNLSECRKMCEIPPQDFPELVLKYANIWRAVLDKEKVGSVIRLRINTWQISGDDVVMKGTYANKAVHGENDDHPIEICASLETGKGVAHIWA